MVRFRDDVSTDIVTAVDGAVGFVDSVSGDDADRFTLREEGEYSVTVVVIVVVVIMVVVIVVVVVMVIVVMIIVVIIIIIMTVIVMVVVVMIVVVIIMIVVIVVIIVTVVVISGEPDVARVARKRHSEGLVCSANRRCVVR